MTLTSNSSRWIVAEANRADVQNLANALGLPHVIARLLLLRGHDDPQSGNDFLNPSVKNLSDPFLLTDMEKTTDRIKHARDNHEPVMIFGDYDVDGISGTAVLTRALEHFGIERCIPTLPNRLSEGYGIGPEHIEDAQKQGIGLIITVDNGIKAYDAAQAARDLHVDMIITDHHTIEDHLPDAFAVINPKREGPDTPFAHASGSAVALKLATALNGKPVDIGLAALGVVADVVPLLRENRILVAAGLTELSADPRPGITALASKAGTNLAELRAENIAFALAPRINAAGRLGDAHSALNLLLTESDQEAKTFANILHEANEDRRSIEKDTVADVEEEIAATLNPQCRSIVAAREGWHPGVIGIVAARLLNAHRRPVIVIAIDKDGIGRGSGRSMAEFDLVEALGECSHLLERFGGHAAAAGLAIRKENIDDFIESFERHAQTLVPVGGFERQLSIDAQIALSEIDGRLLTALDRLEPFGHANPPPLFCSYGVEVLPNSVRELRGGHLKMTVRQGTATFPCIGFNLGNAFQGERFPELADIAFTPKFNSWRGETTIQLQLSDIRAA